MDTRLNHTHITVTRLKRQFGWTDRLIARHLQHQDVLAPNPHNPDSPPMRLFLIARVKRATAENPDLREELRHNQQSRLRSDQQREARRDLSEPDLIATAESMPVRFTDLPTTDPTILIERAIAMFQEYVSTNYGPSACSAISPDSPRAMIQAVHMIRHEFTNYDQLLLDMPTTGQPDTDRKVYQAVRNNVIRYIGANIPALSDTCRQMIHQPDSSQPPSQPTPRHATAHPTVTGGPSMTPDSLVAFDLETIKPFPTGDNWQDHRPLGIACAAVASSTGSSAWYGREPDGSPGERMTQQDASQLVDFLMSLQQEQKTIVTWNGLGFDWQVLAEESDRHQDCIELARRHVDMMYHLFAIKGFPLGLSAAAAGMGVGAKSEGITGSDAPDMWATGRREEVIAYCTQDAALTLQVATACQSRRRLNWTARSGRPNSLSLPSGWLTVVDAAVLPLPDTAWMDNPMSRSAFDAWLADEA